MSNVRHIIVEQDDDGQRLDRWLKKRVPDVPYVLIQKLIRQGQLRIDGKRAKGDTRLKAGQDVRIPPVKTGEEKMREGLSEKDVAFMQSLVIYKDEYIIAINKPHGIAVQGGTGTRRHIDGMLDALTGPDGVRPRLVHRLDRDTSGVLLLARSAEAARALGHMFKDRDIRKIYWALVSPVPEMFEGTIKAPVARMEDRRHEKMVVDEETGKWASTEYAVIEHAAGSAAFVAFWPRTGRMHQIRVHAQLLGSPIIGDDKYTVERREDLDAEPFAHAGIADRLHLHAHRIIAPHPLKKGMLDVSAPLPPELAKSWRSLGFSTSYAKDPFADLDT